MPDGSVCASSGVSDFASNARNSGASPPNISCVRTKRASSFLRRQTPSHRSNPAPAAPSPHRYHQQNRHRRTDKRGPAEIRSSSGKSALGLCVKSLQAASSAANCAILIVPESASCGHHSGRRSRNGGSRVHISCRKGSRSEEKNRRPGQRTAHRDSPYRRNV